MTSQAVEISILGRPTKINCPSGQEQALLQAADELNQRLVDMSSKVKGTSDLQLMTIAALNACYELQSREILDKESVEKDLNKLSVIIDNALAKE